MAQRRWVLLVGWAVGLVAVATVTPPALSAAESVCAAYSTLVERSCAHNDQALLELSRWSPEALEEIGKKLFEREGCEPPSWAAAAVLHTRYALTREPRTGKSFHLAFAARLVGERARADAFRRGWCLVAGLVGTYRDDLSPARSYLEKGLELFEDDPALLVALGATHEVEAWRMRGAIRALARGTQNRRREGRDLGVEQGRRRMDASDLYEEALARDPEHPEAHLRLGRVELLLGHTDQGLARLRWVTEHAEEPDLVYLGHLFVGRERMQSGRVDAALRSFRAALGADPRGQAAYMATSHALRVSGDPAAAAEVLERGLAGRGRRIARDGWWHYPEGRLGQSGKLLTRLRDEVCR